MKQLKSIKALGARQMLVIGLVVFAGLGLITIIAAQASVRTAGFESEASGLSGNVFPTDDSTASGGSSLRFGSASNVPDLSSLNNPAGIDKYDRHKDLSSAQIANLGPGGPYGAFHHSEFTESVRAHNGTHPHGNFRLICTPSHFAYDDPIIFPGQPGKAHLHMFWGNTMVDADTGFNTASQSDNLLERGGSTCQGGVLNRSAYWAPALLSGSGADRKVVMPKEILLYYKSQRPWEVNPLPQGIQLLVGNINPGGSPNDSFSPSGALHWGCNDGGQSRNYSGTIPGTNGTAPCPDGWPIQATLQFPQCIAVENGKPVLTHPDFVSHLKFVGQQSPCPASHPYRVPQISYLIVWDNPAGLAESNWRLSSDTDFDKEFVPNPGGSLHGDWLGGWHEGTIQAWIDGCFLTHNGVAGSLTGRNCSLGQTGDNLTSSGGSSLGLRRMPGQHMLYDLIYTGPQLLDDPAPFYRP